MVLRQERKGMEKKFFELCSKVVKDENLDLYDLDYIPGSHQLRVYIVDPSTGTAVLDDCVKVDRAMTPYIDEADWMPEELVLEVSSPGLYRQLREVEHFKTAVGEKVKLVMTKKFGEFFPDLDLPKKIAKDKTVVLNLKEATDDEITVEYEDKNLNIKYDWIKKANLETELDKF
jgi:ribosome maturation factor RimP